MMYVEAPDRSSAGGVRRAVTDRADEHVDRVLLPLVDERGDRTSVQVVEATTDEARDAAIKRHAQAVVERVRALSSKAYWSQFERSPDFVVLFIPGDQFLTAAVGEIPTLLDARAVVASYGALSTEAS